MAKQNGSKSLSEKQVFTTGEAAELCNVSQQTIIRCFDSGRLQGFRVPGSRFRRIPRAELVKFMKNNEIPVDALESTKTRVLAVDDDPEIIGMLREVLSRNENYEVRTASTGYDAGLLTESFKPHVILLDYMLPDINGNQVCERIKANEAQRDTKVIIVSGVINQDEIEGLRASGADDFVKKPFDINALLAKIEAIASA